VSRMPNSSVSRANQSPAVVTSPLVRPCRSVRVSTHPRSTSVWSARRDWTTSLRTNGDAGEVDSR
jgi:hypothetical protein